MRDGFTRERLFLMELPGILYDLHQEVLRGNNNALFQVLQKRLLAVIGGKLSFFLSVEEEVEERLELKPDQICFLEGILGPSQELTKLAEGVKAELSGLLEYDLWKKQTIREPHSVFFDAERLQTDPILSRLRSLGVEACIRIPLMLKRKEGEPNDTIGFIIVVMDILDQDSQRISTMIADVSTAAENLIFTIELQRTYEEARAASYLGIVDFLISALDQNDPFIRGHSRRVSDICLKMLDSEKWEAKSPALGNEERRNLRMAAELHDVGKLEIPLRIAFKPGRLTQDEEQKFELHSTQGANFARKVGLGERVCLGIRYHHKAFDGSDYPPDGRKEGEIPILARIIRVACAFDNAYSEKCYRIRKEDGFGFLWDLETARKEVEKLRDDKKLDPDIVEALLDVYKNEPDDEEEYIKLIKEGNRIAKGEDMGAARDALRCYEKALQAAPENLSLYMFLAHFASEKLGDLNQAIAYCEQAIERDATSARAHYEHAGLLAQHADFEGALKACNYAITLVPTYIEAHLEKGRIFRRMAVARHNEDEKVRCYDEAMECFKKVLDFGQFDLEAHLEIARLWMERGDFDQALEKCDEVLGIDDMCAEAYILRSGICRQQGKTDDAKAAWRMALEANRWKGKEESSLKKIVEDADRILKGN